MMLELTDEDKKEMSFDGEFYYTTDEMTDAYNNGEKGLIKSRFDFFTNAVVMGKRFSYRDDVTDAEAEAESSETYSNGITETNYLDRFTGCFYSLFKRGKEEILLVSSVFKIGRMYASDEDGNNISSGVLIPLVKDADEGDEGWVMDEIMMEKSMKNMM